MKGKPDGQKSPSPFRMNKAAATGTFRDLLGCVHRPGVQPLTVEQMDEAVGEFLARDNERIREGRE